MQARCAAAACLVRSASPARVVRRPTVAGPSPCGAGSCPSSEKLSNAGSSFASARSGVQLLLAGRTHTATVVDVSRGGIFRDERSAALAGRARSRSRPQRRALRAGAARTPDSVDLRKLMPRGFGLRWIASGASHSSSPPWPDRRRRRGHAGFRRRDRWSHRCRCDRALHWGVLAPARRATAALLGAARRRCARRACCRRSS